MLTDYPVHLRPDARDATPERFFTPANAERYREAASERGIAELGVSEHVHRFHAALDVWSHPYWCENAALFAKMAQALKPGKCPNLRRRC